MTKPKHDSIHRWVKNNHGSITITFNYLKQKYTFNPVSGGKFGDRKDMAIANSVAAQVDMDIKLKIFNGVEKYKPSKLVDIPEKPAPPSMTVVSIWESYKLANQELGAETSQKTTWLAADRMAAILDKIPLAELTMENAIALLQETYKPSYIRLVVTFLHAALNLAVKRKVITDNPLEGFKAALPKHQNRRKKSGFGCDAREKILEAFRSNCYVPKFSNYKHSYYLEFVEFLFLTGLRPQMPIALRWSDIKAQRDGSQVIEIDRAYTKGVLKQGKNNRALVFPVYPQLAELLDRIPHRHPELIFPSPTGGFINLGNFTRRYWQFIVEKLVEDGEVETYFPTYNCRHTAVTFMVASGVPAGVIAALVGTSEVMLKRHYLDENELALSLSIDNLY